MKNRIIFYILVSLSLPFPALYASSIGGAETQGAGKFGVGLDGDYVFSRDIKSNTYTRNTVLRGVGPGGESVFFAIPTKSGAPNINSFYQPMAKVSYGILNNLDMYVKLGTTAGKINEENSGRGLLIIPSLGQSALNIVNSNTRYRIDNSFAYGGGLKGSYDVNWLGGFILGCDLQYLRSENDYTNLEEMVLYNVLDAEYISIRSRWSGKLTIQQWQAAPYIGKKLGSFTPYVGAKYSDIRIKDRPKAEFKEYFIAGMGDVKNIAGQNYKKEYKSRRNIGPFVGLDYKLGDNWKINLEGRFIDETAASLDLMYKF